MGKVLPLALLFFMTIVVSFQVHSQTTSTMGPLEHSLDQEDLQRVMVRYVSSHNSKTSFHEIPPNIAFKAVFVAVLDNPPFPAAFNERDIDIVVSLPSHNSIEFRNFEQAQLKLLCAEMRGSGKGKGVDIYAGYYDNAQRNFNSLLDSHYAAVLESLSPAARDYVLDRYRGYEKTSQIGYAEVDYSRMSKEVPEIAEQLLERGCTNLDVLLESDLYYPETLRESIQSASMRPIQ